MKNKKIIINKLCILISVGLILLSSCKYVDKIPPEIKLIPVLSGNLYQYIDKDGKVVVKAQFGYASVFRDGLALVSTGGDNGKWGYISENGDFAIDANYKSATVFSEGLAWVVPKNGVPMAIDRSGKVKFRLPDAESVINFKEGLSAYALMDNNFVPKYGFVDKTGNIKIIPQFWSVRNFSDGKCAVANSSEKWGFINKEGKILIDYQFERAKDFINNKAVVFIGGKAGLINETGKFVIKPQFSDMADDGDRYLIEEEGKWGWCDKDGKIAITPQFVSAYPFMGKKLTAVQLGESWGYISNNGNWIIKPQFDFAYPYDGNIAMVLSKGKYGFIDENGKYVINSQFDGSPSDYLMYLGSNYGDTDLGSVVTDTVNSPFAMMRMYSEETTQYKIGDELNGGIVFWVDGTGEHGLIVDKEDIGQPMNWNFAMHECEQKGSGWYLPSEKEFKMLYESRSIIPNFLNKYYWCNSLFNKEAGGAFHTSEVYIKRTGFAGYYNTNERFFVRAVRAF